MLVGSKLILEESENILFMETSQLTNLGVVTDYQLQQLCCWLNWSLKKSCMLPVHFLLLSGHFSCWSHNCAGGSATVGGDAGSVLVNGDGKGIGGVQ
jgi:hypothetical protein